MMAVSYAYFAGGWNHAVLMAICLATAATIGVDIGTSTVLSPSPPFAAASVVTAITAMPNTLNLAGTWQACPLSSVTSQARLGSTGTFSSNKTVVASDEKYCFPAPVPGTALRTLLERNGTQLDSVWCDDNLRGLPDISETGRDYYTLLWRRTIPPIAILSDDDGKILASTSVVLPSSSFQKTNNPQPPPQKNTRRVVLHLRGVSYRARVFCNGVDVSSAVLPQKSKKASLPSSIFSVSKSGDTSVQHSSGLSYLTGAFRRWPIEVTPHWRDGESNRVELLIEPPLYPGNATGAQGGDHQMARNGPVSQYTAGWDWIRGTPDRNTGPWDQVELRTTGPVILGDVHVRTLYLPLPGTSTSEDDAIVDIMAELWMPDIDDSRDRNLSAASTAAAAAAAAASVSVVEIRDANGTVVAEATLQNISNPSRPSARVSIPRPRLWWPHTLGDPHLYTVVVTVKTPLVQTNSSACNDDRGMGPVSSPILEVSDSRQLRHGIRTITTHLDRNGEAARTGGGIAGRFFAVNGQRLFLQGGNWISTDQFMRFADDPHRAADEVLLHAHLGLNLIRVWGGGLTERPEFYDAADAAGMLIWQEFWMTGDNNGRWAGNYSWPEDQDVYLDNVRDVVRALRNHPSLMVYVGGNELYPASQSPPPRLAAALPALVKELDPGRIYIASSMSNYTDFDGTYAVAPKDGPYGFLAPCEFAQRNPGLRFWNHSRADNINVYLQPEIGPASCPVHHTMQRFLSPAALAQFPGLHDRDVNEAWTFHNYLGYTDGWQGPLGKGGIGRDHIYSFAAADPDTDDPVISPCHHHGCNDSGRDNNGAGCVIGEGGGVGHSGRRCRTGESRSKGTYAAPRDAVEYAAFAQLAQYQQFKSLFEAFQMKMWKWYSGVLMWKTQSPWPALRGFLYDSWLHQTGGYYGVRSALPTKSLGVLWNLEDRSLVLVNRSPQPLDNNAALKLRLRVYALDGRCVASSETVALISAPARRESAVALLDQAKRPLVVTWPSLSGSVAGSPAASVLLFRMYLLRSNDTRESRVVAANEYWTSHFIPSVTRCTHPGQYRQSFAALGALRHNNSTRVALSASVNGSRSDGEYTDATLHVTNPVRSPLAFAVSIGLSGTPRATACPTACLCSQADARIAPVFFSQNYFTMVPGELVAVSIRFRTELAANRKIFINIEGWNVMSLQLELHYKL